MSQIIKKPHRLGKSFYAGNAIVCYTLNVLEKKKLFDIPEVVLEFEKILVKTAYDYGIDLHIYLFMSTHLHLMVQGKKEDSNSLKMIYMFKQKTGYWLSQNKFSSMWQKDFYDHIVKSDKDIENQLIYILNNPVRAGLVAGWKDYKFKGSTLYDLNKIETF